MFSVNSNPGTANGNPVINDEKLWSEMDLQMLCPKPNYVYLKANERLTRDDNDLPTPINAFHINNLFL